MPNEAYWIALYSTPGVGPVTCRALWERFGDVRNVFAAPHAELARVSGLRRETIAALLHPERAIRAAEEAVSRLTDDGFAVVTLEDASYPRSLLDLRDPPPVLYALGELPGPDERTFSVAGVTEPSARGVDIARTAGRELARAGWTVVSGYAPGVDTAAHTGALAAGGRTVLCLPTGIRTFALRPEFEPFRGELGRNMVLVSECPPDDAWARRHAVARDRIIAALGRALLVVEADVEGGTMITFRRARKLGRPVYVIKYRRPPSAAPGNRQAIRAGGLPVESLAALRRIVRAATLPDIAPRPRQGVLF